jgi:hypothetical protein
MYLVKIRCHCIWVCVLIAKWWRDLHFELNVSTPMFPLCAIRDGRFRNIQDQTDNDPSIKLLFSWGNEILTVFVFFRLEIGENTKILFFGFSKRCLRSPPKGNSIPSELYDLFRKTELLKKVLFLFS